MANHGRGSRARLMGFFFSDLHFETQSYIYDSRSYCSEALSCTVGQFLLFKACGLGVGYPVI